MRKEKITNFTPHVYRLHLIYGHGDGAEVFFHLPMEDIWTVSIQDGTEAAVGFGEKDRFNQPGVVFKSQKFHGIAMLCMHNLSGNQQAGNSNMTADEAMQVHGLDRL